MPETQARPPASSSVLKTLCGWAAFGVVALLFCEIGSRLDDWFFEEVPILENPTYEGMFTFDENGLRRGIPGSRWKKVALNNLGMRGADVPARSAEGCRRWMFLGASETFGEPSMADAEFPARVRALARQRSMCVDVINTAYPGIAPQGLLRYYRNALRPYEPHVVFVYASTHFYLAEDGPRPIAIPAPQATPAVAPEPPTAPAGPSLGSLAGHSRFLERLKDSAEVPAMIQEMRLRRWIEAASSGKPADWAFTRVPEERLELLAADLRELVAEIRASGAQPVLMTHAVRVTSPPREEDHVDLYAMRRYVPRASEAVLAEFEYQAAERVRKLGAELGLPVVDVARELNGKRDRFIDLVHFTQQGHDDIANLVVRSMSADAAEGGK